MATEHHINHYAFSSGDSDEKDQMEEQSRANMPLFLIKNYAWSDLMAMLFGYNDIKKQPSFLVFDKKDDGSRKGPEASYHFIRKQCTLIIEADKMVMKELLAGNDAQTAEDVKAILVRRHTLARRRSTSSNEGVGQAAFESPAATTDVYVMATDLAADRAQI